MSATYLVLVLWSHIGVHEGSHALAHMAVGRSIDSFKPYPHVSNSSFFFGSVTTFGHKMTDTEKLFTAGAPYVADAVLFAASDAVYGYSVGRWRVVPLVGMAVTYLDFLKGYVHGCDWSRIRNTKYGTAMTIIGGALLMVGTWRILSRMKEWL